MFQKAFERYAARRLAEGFAEERQCDIAEVWGIELLRSQTHWHPKGVNTTGRHLSVNTWAWKASSVIHLASLSSTMLK
jgi:superkiller protein 3